MNLTIYQELCQKKNEGKRSFAVLIDPDKVTDANGLATVLLDEYIRLSTASKVDYFLVGGSLVISNHLDECVQQTVEFKNLMSELAKSWQTMLDIQEGFIVKLIARLQASKAQQTVSTSQLPNSAEC